MAETYYMGVAPHNPLGPVANAAALHFALSTPNFLIQEDMLTDVPWRWEVVQHSLTTENGYWLKTDAPGLGIEVDEGGRQEASLPAGSHSSAYRPRTRRRGARLVTAGSMPAAFTHPSLSQGVIP